MDVFERASQQFAAQLPFVLYSKGGEKAVVALCQSDSQLHLLSDYTQQGFVFAPFSGSHAICIPKDQSDCWVDVFEADWSTEKITVLAGADARAQQQFEQLVAKGIEAIKLGEFEKVVLSRRELVKRDNTDFIRVFKRLKATYSTAFCSCFYHPSVGMWIGATPEQLLRVQGDQLFTMALAGTQVNKGEAQAKWGSKEVEEQAYVTQFIVDSLVPHVKEIVQTQPFTALAGPVMHIRTDISGTLNSTACLSTIVGALHPTPAVCGLPKEESRNFILKHEGYDRKYYAGFLGELNFDFAAQRDKRTDLFVNLRCMEVGPRDLTLYVGCGIVRDSDPHSEFAETVNKTATMKKVLN